MPRKQSKPRIEKPGSIGKVAESPFNAAVRGIIAFSSDRQIHVIGQSSEPLFIQAIAAKTPYPEVKNAAESHPNYPRDETENTSRKRKTSPTIL
jgi:hypothetical protein